jgi:hypothetical protein
MRKSNDEPIKQYEFGHIKYTHDLVVKYEDRQIYRVRDESHILRTGTITLETLSETIVAGCKISAFGRGRQLCSGDPSTREDNQWIELRSADGGFSFDFNSTSCSWSRTSKSGYELRDMATDQILMAFVDNSKNLENLKSTLDFFSGMERKFEQICLAALFSLVRRDKGSLDSMTRLALGAATGAVMMVGGGGAGV